LSLVKVAIVGHVDHGKSSILGRLLADTKSLPDGKLERIKKYCEKNSKPFEYAFLLDALKAEQSQGITIDAARSFFKIDKKEYIFLDAPGHIEFIKNMITGAASTDAAPVIDALEGIKENSLRHAYLLSFLNISQVFVIINKMDLVDYSEKIYNTIVNDYKKFLKKQNISPLCFIPISAKKGDNIIDKSKNTLWYNSSSLLDVIKQLNENENSSKKPFRFPVQDVYKFTSKNDSRRIIAGTVLSGSLKKDDEIIFYPSKLTTHINNFENFSNKVISEVSSNDAIGLTIKKPFFTKRGFLAAKVNDIQPIVSKKINVKLFWMGKNPLKKKKKYLLKHLTNKTYFEISEIISIYNTSSFQNEQRDEIYQNEACECILSLEDPIVFDLAKQNVLTSRFVIIDDYHLAGGGLITKNISEEKKSQEVLFKDISSISLEKREKRNKTKSSTIIFSGKVLSKDIKSLEISFFEKNIQTYFYSIDDNIFEKNQKLIFDHLFSKLDLGIALFLHFENISKFNFEIFEEKLKNVYFTSINFGTQKEYFHLNMNEFDEDKVTKIIENNIKY
jgi:bifunctional enzyme CysN/CysC